MAAGLRVAKLCVLLTGNKDEAGQGLNIFLDEMKSESGAEVLGAYLTSSPSMGELSTLLMCPTNQHLAGKLIAHIATMSSSEGRLYAALHAVVTEHAVMLALWLSGDRGMNCCKTSLRMCASFNQHSLSLLQHRLKFQIKGPWCGLDPYWIKKMQKQTEDQTHTKISRRQKRKILKKTENDEDDVRRLGVEFLLSYVQDRREDNACAVAVNTHNFLNSLCFGVEDESEVMQKQIVIGVANVMQCTGIPRSKRAHAFERKGVLSSVVHVALTKSWCSLALSSVIIPSLSVPETASYNLRAKMIPNQVLFQMLKSLHPHKSILHRNILRAVLASAPSLGYHYLSYLSKGVIPLTGSDVTAVMSGVDVILGVLEAPLPVCFERGFLRGDGEAEGEGEGFSESFSITPMFVADYLFPSFVGGALSVLLKHSNMLIVLQAFSVIAVCLKKIRFVLEKLERIHERQVTLVGGQRGDVLKRFVSEVRLTVSQRLPTPGVFLCSKVTEFQAEEEVTELSIASHTALLSGGVPAKKRAALFRLERMLFTLRILQKEVPGYMAGVSVVKALFPDRLPSAEIASRADRTAACASSLLTMTPSAVLLLLQLISHNSALKPAVLLGARDFTAFDTTTGETVDAKTQSSPLAEVLYYFLTIKQYTTSKGEDVTEAFRLKAECVYVVQVLLKNICVTALTEPSLDFKEVETWLEALETAEDCREFCVVVNQLFNDVCAEKTPFATGVEKEKYSPLFNVTKRETAKDNSIKHILAKFKTLRRAHTRPHQQAHPTTSNWETPSIYSLAKVKQDIQQGLDEGDFDAGLATLFRTDRGADMAVPAPSLSSESPLAQYKGTLSAEDQRLYGEIKEAKLLEGNYYQLLFGDGAGGFDAAYPLRLASKVLGDKRMQHTVNNYPRQTSEDGSFVPDEALVDPRHFTEVVAAHLSVGCSREVVIVPEIRRYALCGITPMLIRGLSSGVNTVRKDAYTALGCMKAVVPQNTPFYILLSHIANSCWEKFARLPVSLTSFFCSACEAVFSKASSFNVLSNLTKYLLSFPYTRRTDLPFSEYLIKPAQKGQTSGIQLFTLQTVQSTLHSMKEQNGGICGNSIGAFSNSSVFFHILSVIQNPLVEDNVRERAVKVIETAASVIPTVLLLKLRVLPTIAFFSTSIRQSQTGDVRVVTLSKIWSLRTRLCSAITLNLLHVGGKGEEIYLLSDYLSCYNVLLMFFVGLGEEITSNAAEFASVAILTIELLASVIVKIYRAHTTTGEQALQPLHEVLLPMPFKTLKGRLAALVKAHAITEAASSLPRAKSFLKLLEDSLAEFSPSATQPVKISRKRVREFKPQDHTNTPEAEPPAKRAKKDKKEKKEKKEKKGKKESKK